VEKHFLLPRVISDKDFLEKNPLQVAAADKAAILGMDDESGRDRIIDDSAGLLRMLETVLVLHEDRSNRRNDFEKLKAANAKLDAENMKLENEVVDLRGKKENFVAAAKENRELKEELAKLEEEMKSLKSAMAHVVDETENTRDLLTRAEFVARIRKLGDSVLAGVKHGWQNALAQVKVANAGVELNFDGMGVFREVVDGQIILPDRYKEAEAADLAGEEEMDDDAEEEEDDGTSKKTTTPEDDV
jgi:predicted RNase H-like nuclease (RuvC/YqgF family)